MRGVNLCRAFFNKYGKFEEVSQMNENKNKTYFDMVTDKFKAISPKAKKCVIIGATIVVLILGIFVGCKCNVSHSDYQIALSDVEKAKQETAKVKKEYDEYKSKMKPYEDQQEADAKAAKEKAAAEKAAKEAEEKAAAEKAAKEAEEKARQEATKKQQSVANSLGITVEDFINKFRTNCATINSTISINNPSYSDKTTAYITTSKNDISFNAILDNGYIKSLSINYTIDLNTNTDYETYTDVVLASAYSIDNTVASQDFANFLDTLLKSETHTENTYNGIKYRVDSDIDYITLTIRN